MTQLRPEAAYKALAAELREAILAGKFPPGQRLPTEAELASARRLSRQTVRQAFQELVSETLVYRVRGRGTFASPAASEGFVRSLGSIDELQALELDTELHTVESLTMVTDVAAASRLNLSTDHVIVGRFVRYFNDVPFCETTSYFPMDIGRRLIEDGTVAEAGSRTASTVISLIERVADVTAVGAQQSIVAIMPPSDVQALIECEPNQPVLRIDRLYFDRNGRKLQLAINHFNSSRYSYRLELRRST